MNMPVRAPRMIADHAAFQTVPVRWVRHWNEHLFSFAVERPASFRFRSGEFVMIGLPGEGDAAGRPLMRAYSIASPAWSDELEFLSIKVTDGPLTSRLPDDPAGRPALSGQETHRHAGTRRLARREKAVPAVDRHRARALPERGARPGGL